ncbi:hypothetical protein [Streptomyces sp. NPDC001833]|uniref:hypothetical protein n=1 Tax=Streptomyces sp. NPDC001833 TaxID=3154658 RepID=UPI0033213573
MSEHVMETLGRPEVLIIIDWRDGPVEGILRRQGEVTCWYFRLFAERPETAVLDDRIFALWVLPDADGAVLTGEFGEAGHGAHVWPVSGGLGSVEARRIVDGILSAGSGSPHLLVRTSDFLDIMGVWEVVASG